MTVIDTMAQSEKNDELLRLRIIVDNLQSNNDQLLERNRELMDRNELLSSMIKFAKAQISDLLAELDKAWSAEEKKAPAPIKPTNDIGKQLLNFPDSSPLLGRGPSAMND